MEPKRRVEFCQSVYQAAHAPLEWAVRTLHKDRGGFVCLSSTPSHETVCNSDTLFQTLSLCAYRPHSVTPCRGVTPHAETTGRRIICLDKHSHNRTCAVVCCSLQSFRIERSSPTGRPARFRGMRRLLEQAVHPHPHHAHPHHHGQLLRHPHVATQSEGAVGWMRWEY